MNEVVDKKTGEITKRPSVEGYGNLDLQVDVTLPRWRLIQPSSKIDGGQGEFNHNLTNEVRAKIEMVIVYITPSRVEFDSERRLVCYSHDGIKGMLGLCAQCPRSRWPEDKSAPKCGPGFTYVGMHPETAELYAISAQGKSVKAAKAYHSSLFNARMSPWAVVTEWGSKKVVDKHKYFILTVKRTGITSEQVRETAREMAEWVKEIRFIEADEPLATHDQQRDAQVWEQEQEPAPDGDEEEFERENLQ